MHMIKKLLILVFLGFSGAVLAQADARDPDKLKLASANALIVDAQAGEVDLPGLPALRQGLFGARPRRIHVEAACAAQIELAPLLGIEVEHQPAAEQVRRQVVRAPRATGPDGACDAEGEHGTAPVDD